MVHGVFRGEWIDGTACEPHRRSRRATSETDRGAVSRSCGFRHRHEALERSACGRGRDFQAVPDRRTADVESIELRREDHAARPVAIVSRQCLIEELPTLKASNSEEKITLPGR